MAIYLLLFILAIVVAYFYWFKSYSGTGLLYDRLGGAYNIAAVIDHFSDNLIKNPKVGEQSPNPQLREWSTSKLHRLAGLKFMRTLWVCDVTGGPYKFIATKPSACPLSLNKAHAEFHITSDEFDEVARELTNSLDYYKVPAKEKSEVLAAFAAHKADVVGP